MAAERTRGGEMAVRVLARAAVNFVDDRCSQHAAAISYFALFSLFPLTLLAVSVFGIALRDLDTRANMTDLIVGALPVAAPNVADSLRAVAHLGPTLTLISLAGSLWAAGALSGSVQRAINVAFNVRRTRPMLWAKLLDYLLLPVLGVVFLGSIVATAAWRVIAVNASDIELLQGRAGTLIWLGSIAIPALGTFVTFLLLYWLLPNRSVAIRYLWPGALLAAALFEAVKAGFATYLAHASSYDVVYGSLGGVVALLFWVYVSANILLFGAEVAAEMPHVLHGEGRRGNAGGGEGNWRTAVWHVLRGLVLAPPDDD